MQPGREPRIDPDQLRHHRFATSFRGYEPNAVDALLQRLAGEVEALNRWIDELLADNNRLRSDGLFGGGGGGGLADAGLTDASKPRPLWSPHGKPSATEETNGGWTGGGTGGTTALGELDEAALIALVGEETARVIGSARRAAEEIRSKAEESAAREIRGATQDAHKVRSDASEEARQLRENAELDAASTSEAANAAAESARAAGEAEATRIVDQARTTADQVLAEGEAGIQAARSEAEAITAAARDQGRSMVEEAKSVRTRVLDDLAQRRSLGRAQIERLAAGRDRLLEAYAAVRADLDAVTTELEAAMPDGRRFEEETPARDADVAAVEAGTVPLADAPTEEPADDTRLDEVAEVDADEPVEAEVQALPEDDVVEAQDEAGIAVEAVDEAGGEAGEAPADSEPDVVDEVDEVAAPGEVADGVADVEDVVDLRGDDPADDGLVDELFARIRADRAAGVAKAHEVLAPIEPDLAPAPAVPAVATAPRPAPAAKAAKVAGAPWAGRDEVLDQYGPALHKALKRVLADEQNEVLDTLRRTQSSDAAKLLPDPDEHRARYADRAAPALRNVAVAAGATAEVDIADVAGLLAATVVEPFRRRVERVADDAGDPDELDARLRALYREQKSHHLVAATDDALLGAYALGVFDNAPDDASLQWAIDPKQGPCPDAEDNALAGPVTKGVAFPTGDVCPQAHPGCRCLAIADT